MASPSPSPLPAHRQVLVSVHDSVVALLLDLDRQWLARTICRAAQFALPTTFEVRERSPNLETPAVSKRGHRGVVDGALQLLDTKGRPLLTLVLEIQTSWDPHKRWTWALYAAVFSASTRAPSRTVVFSPYPRLRARLRELLAKTVPRPQLIEADQITPIDDFELARVRPHQTIFAAIYHARETSPETARVAYIQAALVALQLLGDLEFIRYAALMQSVVPSPILERAKAQHPEVDEALGRLLDGEIEYIKDTPLYLRAHGQGLEQMMKRALVDLLSARGLTVSTEIQARIAACSDRALLERWYTRAAAMSHGMSIEGVLEAGV